MENPYCSCELTRVRSPARAMATGWRRSSRTRSPGRRPWAASRTRFSRPRPTMRPRSCTAARPPRSTSRPTSKSSTARRRKGWPKAAAAALQKCEQLVIRTRPSDATAAFWMPARRPAARALGVGCCRGVSCAGGVGGSGSRQLVPWGTGSRGAQPQQIRMWSLKKEEFVFGF